MAGRKQGKAAAAASGKTPAATTGTQRRSPRGRKSTTSGAVNPEQRHRMIAEAAYYIAEQRGFNGGDSVRDWLLAENEIDRRLAG